MLTPFSGYIVIEGILCKFLLVLLICVGISIEYLERYILDANGCDLSIRVVEPLLHSFLKILLGSIVN